LIYMYPIIQHGWDLTGYFSQNVFLDDDQSGPCWTHIFLCTRINKIKFGKIHLPGKNIRAHIAYQWTIHFWEILYLGAENGIIGSKMQIVQTFRNNIPLWYIIEIQILGRCYFHYLSK